MKKFFAGLVVSVATLLLCIVMSACSSSFEGTYKFYSMSAQMGGVSINYEVGKEYSGVTFNEDVYTLTVNEDNTWTMEIDMFGSKASAKGTWEEKDGKYYLTTEGESQAIEATLDGNKINFEKDGSKVTLKK